jgi:hypothetical protein
VFRSKRDFLFKALDHYSDQVVDTLFCDATEGSACAAIARTFESVIDRAGMEGCFLQNCAIELAHRDAETRVAVRHGPRRLEKAYYKASGARKLASHREPQWTANARPRRA